jgi:hypothetical protein
MRKSPVFVVAGLGLLAALPVLAAGTRLGVTCTTRDLPPGAHVWIEVVPEYYQTTQPSRTSDRRLRLGIRGACRRRGCTARP